MRGCESLLLVCAVANAVSLRTNNNFLNNTLRAGTVPRKNCPIRRLRTGTETPVDGRARSIRKRIMAGLDTRRRGRRLLLLGLLLWLAAPSFAQEPCLKLVFGLYCLGGDINPLLRQTPKPTIQQNDGERLALVYTDGRERFYVMAFRSRIYKVLKRYRTATQLKYEDLYAILREKYGAGEDRSRFPDYATNPAGKLGSIRRGEGRAVHVWEPDPAWSIELAWTREMGLALSYIATAINVEQRAELESGL